MPRAKILIRIPCCVNREAAPSGGRVEIPSVFKDLLMKSSSFHLDHASALPYVLAKTNFRGRVFMTHPTKAIYKWLIRDSVRVQWVKPRHYTIHDMLNSYQKPLLFFRPTNNIIHRSRTSFHISPDRSHRLQHYSYRFFYPLYTLSSWTRSWSCNVFN